MGPLRHGNDQDDQIAARVAAWMRFVNCNAIHRPAEFGACVCVCSRARFRLSRFGVSDSLRTKVHG